MNNAAHLPARAQGMAPVDPARECRAELARMGIEIDCESNHGKRPTLSVRYAEPLWLIPNHRLALVLPDPRDLTVVVEVWEASFHGCLLVWQNRAGGKIVTTVVGRA